MSECIAPCCISPLSDAFKLVGTENLVYSFTRTHAEASARRHTVTWQKTDTKIYYSSEDINELSAIKMFPHSDVCYRISSMATD